MSIEWFRWYHSTVSDPKFAACARKAHQPKTAVIATWAAVLEYASQHEDRGSLEGLDVDTLSACLDLDEEAVDTILAALTAKGLIADGRIAKWEKRQVTREREDDSKERVRRYRERLEEKQTVTTGNAFVTPSNATPEPAIATVTPVTPPREEEEEIREDQTREDKPPQEERAATTLADARARALGGGRKVPKAGTPMPTDWFPGETAYSVLIGLGIPRPFAEGCIPEFRLYWMERGDARPGWDASFVNSVKRSWDKRPRDTKVMGQRRPGQTIAERITEEHEIIFGPTNEPDPFSFLPKPTPPHDGSRLIEGEVIHGRH